MRRILAVVFIILSLSLIIFENNVFQYTVFAQERNQNLYLGGESFSPITINASGAVLIEQVSGRILYEKDGKKRMYPASTTKILTALIAIENGDLDEVITVGDEIRLIDPKGSRAWLKIGERMKLSNLLMGLMLPSGNDAAYTIALSIGRKLADNPSLKKEDAIRIFIDKMNERAREIGAVNSNFVNPHGLHNKGHYSTPYDMALIAREAFKNEFFKKVVITYKYEGLNTSNLGHRWINTNKLLDRESKSFYKYATGIKTGHTIPAGYCLVSSGSKDGMDVIAVVLNTSQEGQWEDSKKLLDYGLNNFIHHVVIEKGDILQSIRVANKLPSDRKDLDLIAAEGFKEVFFKEDIPSIKWIIEWNSELITPSDNTAEGIKILSSIYKGEILGKAVYTLNGEVLKEINIVSGSDIKKSYGIFNFPGIAYIYQKINIIFPLWLFLTAIFTLYIVKIIRTFRKR